MEAQGRENKSGEQCTKYCSCKWPSARAKVTGTNLLKMEAAGYSEMF
jgi:hypothetical protein